jgi:hypothetical protein
MTDDSESLNAEDLDDMVKRAATARTLLNESGIDVPSLDDVERLVAEVRRLHKRTDRAS